MKSFCRVLTGKSGEEYIVGVSMPHKVSEQPEEWSCRVSVGTSISCEIYGVDAFQVIINVIEYLRLKARELDLTWLGGEFGDAGFPPIVPEVLPGFMKLEIQCFIEKKVDEFHRLARARHRFSDEES